MKAGTQASTEPKNSTIPIKGLQYVISPSLPTPVQKHLNAMVVQDAAYNKLSAARTSHDTTSKEKKTNEQRPMPPHGTLPKLNGAYSALPLMGTYQINMLDITHGNCLDDPSFADTLSRIGPSARRLLQMEEDGKQEGDEGRGTQGGTTSKSRLNQSLPRPVDPPNPRSGSRASNRMSKTLGGTMGGTSGRSNVLKPFDGTSTFLRSHGATDKLGTGEAVAQPPKGATLHSTLSRRENVAHYNTAREVPLLESTLTRKPNLEPPLVATLRTYLEREVRLAQDGGVVPTVMDHLGPYREAFGALITAFPGYAGVLSDIRSAYDNVIQCQAALLSDAESKEELTIQQTAKHQEDTKALNTYIDELHRGLETMKTDFQHRESAMAKKLEQRYNADHSRIDNYELRRQLERADARSEELERNSRGDLQKIMVLIGAVRECDKRMKEFELTVKHMAGQVEELDEFKRLAGEAQTELQLYKEKFKAFIPSCDFQLMKDYLTDELAASRAMARRMRRTATVRGTQVDVLTRRLKQLEEEAHAEPREGSPLVSGIIPRTDGRLTPRPQWDHFHETLPELYEFSKDIHCNSLTSTKRHPEDRHDGEILVVDGPSGTTLQVEFLVERVNTLNQQVTQLDAERRAASTALQQLQAQQPPTGLPQDIMAVSVSSKPTSARGPSKARGANDGITTLANLHIYPIIGPGVSPNVPKHLRTTGIIERTVLEQGVSVRLVFDFFHNSLLPSFTNEILDAPALLFDFLTEALATREELGAFAAPAHIALNLMEDARDPHLTNPALFLLRNIMSGAMPVRLAVDAVAVLSHIITDLKAIAKEQQKARLRRQTISECLSPILELKPREELIDLRAALGGDTTFDTIYLTTISNRFMCTLFFQECQAGMDMYVEILRRLTTRAEPLNDQTGDSSISLSSVAEVVREVEPLTPEVVLREISVNAIGKIDEPVNPDAPEPVFALLSEVIKAIGVAPLIRRTIRGTREECAL